MEILLFPALIYSVSITASVFLFRKPGHRRSGALVRVLGLLVFTGIVGWSWALFSSIWEVLIAAIFMFSLAEIVIRAGIHKERDPKGIYRFHPFMLFEVIPGSVRRKGIRHNNYGFRGPDIEKTKPEGVTRIFLVGDSTTYDYQGPQGGHTGDFLAEELAARHPEKRFEVLNAGVENYQSMQGLILIASRMVDFSPDIIIALHATNDAALRMLDGYSDDYSEPYVPFVYPPRVWWERSVILSMLFAGKTNFDNPWFPQKLNSFFDLALKSGPRKLLQKTRLMNEETKGNITKNTTHAYRRNLLSMVGLGAVHNFNLVFCTQPTNGSSDRIRAIGEHNEIIRSICAERDVKLVDLDGSFSQKEEFFSDFMHMNIEGQKKKAATIAEALGGLL